MRAQCIGGPQDGQWLDADGEVAQLLRSPSWSRYLGLEGPMDAIVEHDTYRLERYALPGQDISTSFWVHEGMTPSAMQWYLEERCAREQQHQEGALSAQAISALADDWRRYHSPVPAPPDDAEFWRSEYIWGEGESNIPFDQMERAFRAELGPTITSYDVGECSSFSRSEGSATNEPQEPAYAEDLFDEFDADASFLILGKIAKEKGEKHAE